ncbi:unnamed protein product, partial [Ixodes persulcatus]
WARKHAEESARSQNPAPVLAVQLEHAGRAPPSARRPDRSSQQTCRLGERRADERSREPFRFLAGFSLCSLNRKNSIAANKIFARKKGDKGVGRGDFSFFLFLNIGE